MVETFSRRSGALIVVCCLAALALSALPARGQYDPDWSRHFRLGGMVGFNIKADFRTPATLNLGGNQPAGVFDNGYVLKDQTGNAGGYTTYWGYDSSSQISGQTLNLTKTTAFTSSSGSSTSQEGGTFAGMEMAYGGNLWYWKRVRIGWDLGFGLLPISITANQSLTGSADQSKYSFDTGGNIMPAAPYHGPFQAPSAGSIYPPLLPSTPISTNVTSTSDVTLTGSQTLDVMLYTFRLGPSFYWDFNRHLGMSVGAGPALGIVSGDLKYNEILSTGARPQGRISATDVVYGGYVNATLMYHAVQNGDLYVGVQYMPLGNAKISGGGREAELKLSGAVYVSAGFNWPF